jgi:hypothetical protein
MNLARGFTTDAAALENWRCRSAPVRGDGRSADCVDIVRVEVCAQFGYGVGSFATKFGLERDGVNGSVLERVVVSG